MKHLPCALYVVLTLVHAMHAATPEDVVEVAVYAALAASHLTFRRTSPIDPHSSGTQIAAGSRSHGTAAATSEDEGGPAAG